MHACAQISLCFSTSCCTLALLITQKLLEFMHEESLEAKMITSRAINMAGLAKKGLPHRSNFVT